MHNVKTHTEYLFYLMFSAAYQIFCSDHGNQPNIDNAFHFSVPCDQGLG